MRGWFVFTRSCRASWRRWNSTPADAPPCPSTTSSLGGGPAAPSTLGGASGASPTGCDPTASRGGSSGSTASSGRARRGGHSTHLTVLLARS